MPWYERFFVIYPDSLFYKIWQLIIVFNCALTSILYPYCTLNEFLQFTDNIFLIIMVSEVIMILDIIFNMLLAYKDDDDIRYITDI